MNGSDQLDQAADQLLAKVRAFADSLDEDERSLFAALLAPGIAAAWQENDAEVEGFGSVWSESRLHTHLRNAIRSKTLRIESD